MIAIATAIGLAALAVGIYSAIRTLELTTTTTPGEYRIDIDLLPLY